MYIQVESEEEVFYISKDLKKINTATIVRFNPVSKDCTILIKEDHTFIEASLHTGEGGNVKGTFKVYIPKEIKNIKDAINKLLVREMFFLDIDVAYKYRDELVITLLDNSIDIASNME